MCCCHRFVFSYFYVVPWGSFLYFACCILFLRLWFLPVCLHLCLYSCVPCLCLYSCFSVCLALRLYFYFSTCLCFSSWHYVWIWMTHCSVYPGMRPSSHDSSLYSCSSFYHPLVCCVISPILEGFCCSDVASTNHLHIALNVFRLCDYP